MGVGFIEHLVSTAGVKLEESVARRTLQVPGKWLLHFCHDFTSLLRDLGTAAQT
jgi:hypothetical protein